MKVRRGIHQYIVHQCANNVLSVLESKTEEEKALEESIFGKDILADKVTSHWIEDLDQQVDFNIDTNPNKGVAVASDGPAWVDDDDDHLHINLDETNRLKKLKKADSSAVVTGSEFTSLLQER